MRWATAAWMLMLMPSALLCGACDRSGDKVAPSATAVTPAPPSALADPLLGRPAPDFTAVTQDGDRVRLADLRGQHVILYFYPQDETPGCSLEADSLRDAYSGITAKGALLYGISNDDDASHRAFASNHKLPFPLISDPAGQIARLFGVPWRDGHAQRQTIVVGEDGRVERVYRHVDPSRHAAELLTELR